MLRIHPYHWSYRLKALVSNPAFWIGVGLAFLVTVLIVLLQTHLEKVTVTKTFWEQKVEVEKFALRPFDGFEPPRDAVDVTPNGTRIHHYNRVFSHYTTDYVSEQVPCGQSCSGSGSNRSCYTQYCSRLKTKQRAVYRDDPVYRPYYAWKAWRWGVDRERSFTGTNAPWRIIDPEEFEFQVGLNPGEAERFTVDSEYSITFSNREGETWGFSPNTQKVFSAYPLGSLLDIEVNGFGSILTDLELSH